MKFIEKVINFLKEVKTEVKKVNWPTKQEVFKYTAIVLGVSVVVAVFLGGLDTVYRAILDKLMGLV